MFGERSYWNLRFHSWKATKKMYSFSRQGSGALRQQMPLTQALQFELRHFVPLRVLVTPCLLSFPSSFRTSSLETYLCFLVDFYNLRCIQSTWIHPQHKIMLLESIIQLKESKKSSQKNFIKFPNVFYKF